MANSLFKRIAKVWSAAAGAARGAPAVPMAPRFDLAVFGKHPGWDDHIPDDVGLDTARLVEAKQRLYLQGIGGNIDGGTWDKLPPSQQVAFAHAFAWRPAPADGAAGDRELLVGRLWHSSDGKGRERYPMVACAALANAPPAFVAEEVFPALEALAAECAAARSETAVRSAVGRVRDTLRSRLGGSTPTPWTTAPPSKTQPTAPNIPESAPVTDGGPAASDDSTDATGFTGPSENGAAATPTAAPSTSATTPRAPLAFLADQPEMGPGHQGLLRLMYLIRQEMASFRVDGASANAKGGFSGVKPQQARVPACDEDAGAAALRWLDFLATRLDERAPILVLVPVTHTPGAGWADLIAGEATATQLYCLRAGPEALPFSTAIPYNLPPDFVINAEQEIEASRGAAGR